MKNKGKRKKTPSTGQDKACSMPSPNKKDKKKEKRHMARVKASVRAQMRDVFIDA